MAQTRHIMPAPKAPMHTLNIRLTPEQRRWLEEQEKPLRRKGQIVRELIEAARSRDLRSPR